MKAFEEVDIILTPTMPMPAFKIGENTDDPMKMWLADAFTVSVNPIGVPGLSVNAGYTEDGLPVGMQLIAEKPLLPLSLEHYYQEITEQDLKE